MNSVPSERKVDDLSGQTFGRWKVLRRDMETVKNGGRRPNYICECECGTVRSVPRQAMTKGESKSCGCLHKEIVSANGLKDLTGQKFGRLSVVKRDDNIPKSGRKTKGGDGAKWICECECGNISSVKSYSLTAGITVSCGCYHREMVSTHGGYGDRLYNIWKGVLARCENPQSPAYKDYGGRGINVCPEWHDINAFKRWALANGYKDDLTIERVDVDGNYEPSNVTFIPRSEQSKNRRNVIKLEAWGEIKTCREWELDSRCKVSAETLKARYYRREGNKMTIEEMISVPEMHNKGVSYRELSNRKQIG